MKRKPRILVVGSFVMDHIARTRVFPEQGETVLGESMQKAPGGKGANQAVQAARLGAEVTMLGKLGGDANGREILDICKQAGIDTGQILLDKTETTGCSIIILEQDSDGTVANRIIVIPGANARLRPEETDFLREEIGRYDMVLLQLEIAMEVNIHVAQIAAKAGVPVMLNPAPDDVLPEELLACLNYISPNEHEAYRITNVKIPNEPGAFLPDKAREAAQVLRSAGVKDVIITLGSSGAVDLNNDGFFYAPSVRDTKVVDPTAAGDSFVAAFCCAVSVGMESKKALCFANHTAAITVSRLGAMPSLPTLREVEESMKRHGIAFEELAALRGDGE